jgi:hypothetical protein
MKSFLDYCKYREEEGLADIDAMPNEDEMLLKIAKMAISRHQERILEFFNALSRSDDDIKNLLNKYKDKRSSYSPHDLKVRSDAEKDIVAPNSADMADPV